MKRREFAKNTMMASCLLSAAPLTNLSETVLPPATSLKKGIMWGSIGTGHTIMEKFKAAEEAGFDGVEAMSHMNRDEVIEAKKATGMPVPSVCGELHWKYPLSDPDPEVRKKGLDALKTSLEDAAAYGADTVLLVPGIVSETVGYDDCWKRSSAEISKAVPLAEKLRVIIAVENVWNNFLLSPMEAVTYIDQFKSQYVGAYFDCGNILAYGWPEQWIRILGNRIAKVHIKEYSRKLADKQGKGAGFNVKLTEGDVNWHLVMKALEDAGYGGWTTIEQPGGDSPQGLKDLCDRLAIIQKA